MIEDEWISHKDLKVTKDIVAIHVDTRDFSLVCTTNKEDKPNIDDNNIIGNPEYSFTTQQMKALINKLFKESGGEKKWRFLHFINEEKKLIIGGNWQFRYLRFYKCKPNIWICKPREDSEVVKRDLFDLLVFGDIMSSHDYSKKKGWIDEKSEFDETQIATLKASTRESEIEASKKKKDIRIPKTKPKVKTSKKVYRNDPCPCGSGKKHKKCCLNK